MNFDEYFRSAWKQSIFSVFRVLSPLSSVSLSHWLFSDLNSTLSWSLYFHFVCTYTLLNILFFTFQISFSFCLLYIARNFTFHCVPIFYFLKKSASSVLPIPVLPPHWQPPVCSLYLEICFLVSLFFLLFVFFS